MARASNLRLLQVAAAPCVLAYAIAAVVVPRSGSPPTTYAGASVAAHAADLTAGLGLLAAGLVALIEPRTRRLATLAILAGVAWFGPDWEGWDHGAALARSIGATTPSLFLALVFHLVLSFPSGRLHFRIARIAVVALYVLAAGVSLCRALFRDPFLDPYCWRNCIDNSFLVHADQGLIRTLDAFWFRASLAIGLLLVAGAVWTLLVASRPARRLLLPGLGTGALIGAAVSAYAAALLRNRLEDPQASPFGAIFLTQSFAVFALAVGIGWHVLRLRRARSSIAHLVTELAEAPQPGGLQNALAVALGDPTLAVVYWLPRSQSFVDGAGRDTRRPMPERDRAVTSITRGGNPVAEIVHDRALLDGPDLEREIGSAARLAVENERLQAEVLAQLEAVRESRARIVETADAERRRLERDLHDGAQQLLLALSYELRLAHAEADQNGDSELATLLASTGEETQIALDELRELAHGIYPAILTEAGLEAALATLADTSPLPVELAETTLARYAPPVETAAYATAAEAIADAAARGATFVVVKTHQENDMLVVATEDDGKRRGSPLTHISDRVGALGGHVEDGPMSLRAEIPCA